MSADPIRQFVRWFSEAHAAGVPDVNAMTLATVDAEGRPSARVVLLKTVNHQGFTFFTNYQSDKGVDLAGNPQAALTFFWPGLGRQVRIAGEAAKLSPEDSQAYFKTRPRASQVAAWASRQSRPVADRAELEARFAEAAAERHGRAVPCPAHWGGYRLSPRTIGFWQRRENRLHDRFRYRRGPDGRWLIERLSP